MGLDFLVSTGRRCGLRRLIMWVVYYEGRWGHKYFNEKSNAEAYFQESNKYMPGMVYIEEIETED